MNYIAIGLESSVLAWVEESLGLAPKYKVREPPQFQEVLHLAQDPAAVKQIRGILCGASLKFLDTKDMIRILKKTFPEMPIFYVTEKRERLEPSIMTSQGFQAVFFHPFDRDLLKAALEQWSATTSVAATPGQPAPAPIFREVKLIDLEPNEVLDFDLYLLLPANRKYLRYVGRGQGIADDQYQRLGRFGVNSVFVRLEELPRFYEFTGRKLAKLSESVLGQVSETERKERMKRSVQMIFVRIFGVAEGKPNPKESEQVREEIKGLVEAWVLQSPQKGLYERIQSQIGELTSNYTHAMSVSLYAALFSSMLGVGTPAELAIAALVHDVGEADIPEEIVKKGYENLDSGERLFYEGHVDSSLRILRARKLGLPEPMFCWIGQHHERVNGSGYPQGLHSGDIARESQVLALADSFDELTQLKEGVRKYRVEEAIEVLDQRSGYDPILVKQLRALLVPTPAPGPTPSTPQVPT